MFIGSNPGGVGYYEISDGSLSVANANNAGLRLGGATSTGTLKVIGAEASISIGTQYVQNNGSTLAFDIGSAISPIGVGGNTTLAGILAISFSAQPMVGQQFTLINYGGSLAGSFSSFDALVNGPGGPDSIGLSISYGTGSNSAVSVNVTSVVPEPSSLVLCGTVLVGMFGFRSLRKSTT